MRRPAIAVVSHVQHVGATRFQWLSKVHLVLCRPRRRTASRRSSAGVGRPSAPSESRHRPLTSLITKTLGRKGRRWRLSTRRSTSCSTSAVLPHGHIALSVQSDQDRHATDTSEHVSVLLRRSQSEVPRAGPPPLGPAKCRRLHGARFCVCFGPVTAVAVKLPCVAGVVQLTCVSVCR